MTSKKYAKTLTEVTCDAKLRHFTHAFFFFYQNRALYSFLIKEAITKATPTEIILVSV